MMRAFLLISLLSVHIEIDGVIRVGDAVAESDLSAVVIEHFI